jgi:hypothetical protein
MAAGALAGLSDRRVRTLARTVVATIAGVVLSAGDCGPGGPYAPDPGCCCGLGTSVLGGFARRDEPAPGQIEIDIVSNGDYAADLSTVTLSGAPFLDWERGGYGCGYDVAVTPDGTADIVIELDYACPLDEEERLNAGCHDISGDTDRQRVRAVIPLDWWLGARASYWVTWEPVDPDGDDSAFQVDVQALAQPLLDL